MIIALEIFAFIAFWIAVQYFGKRITVNRWRKQLQRGSLARARHQGEWHQGKVKDFYENGSVAAIKKTDGTYFLLPIKMLFPPIKQNFR